MYLIESDNIRLLWCKIATNKITSHFFSIYTSLNSRTSKKLSPMHETSVESGCQGSAGQVDKPGGFDVYYGGNSNIFCHFHPHLGKNLTNIFWGGLKPPTSLNLEVLTFFLSCFSMGQTNRIFGCLFLGKRTWSSHSWTHAKQSGRIEGVWMWMWNVTIGANIHANQQPSIERSAKLGRKQLRAKGPPRGFNQHMKSTMVLWTLWVWIGFCPGR